jgi:hypothetical protein
MMTAVVLPGEVRTLADDSFPDCSKKTRPRHGRTVTMLRHLSILSVVLAGWLVAVPARACNIPVFRYALERWRPDAYEVIVFHRGPLSADLEKTAAELRKAGDGRSPHANVEVTTVDLAGDVEEPMRKLWEAQKDAALPWMVLRYPAMLKIGNQAWAGPFTKDAVAGLLQSPARKEIAQRLLKGGSAVWLLVESGDAKKDDAAAQLLTAQLKELEKSIKLPDDADVKEDPDKPPVKLLSEVPLKVSFSVLRVSRTDAKENILLGMLLSADDMIAKARREPVMFPIFGRGRALDAFVGKEITADVIGEVSRFLCGACSCTVKALNPGVDLLFSADWDAILEGGAPAPEPVSQPGKPVPIPQPGKTKGLSTPSPVEGPGEQGLSTSPLQGPGELLPPPPPQEGAASGSSPAEAPAAAVPARSSLSRYLWLAAGAVVLLLLVSSTFALKPKKSNGEPTP